MGEIPVVEQIYAAPKSRLPFLSLRRPISRFWLTCLICSVVLPATAILLVSYEISALPLTLFLLACWLIPVGWILLPELRHGGIASVSSGRALAISVGFFAATATIAFVLAATVSLAYWLLVVSRHGT